MDITPLMINGLPGNVAKTMAMAAATDPRFVLVPFSLTGPDIPEPLCQIKDIECTLVKPNQRDTLISDILDQYPGLIAVDYTHPTAVNANARFYVANQIPFVMGTTGGDRKAIKETVKKGSCPAVVAPNMAKQIVGFQAMMEHAAQTFPGLFKGYTLKICESHQQAKADTSGTARAMVAYFNEFGLDFKVEDICKIRDPKIQANQWGIPREHLDGHAWHTYTLTSPDESVCFQFKHNVNGRNIYVDGTFDAVFYLKNKIRDPENLTRFFTMIDVLKNN